MEEKEGMTQKKLAELMNVSPQQISKILKGQENLTLETISKLSETLGVDLISFPELNTIPLLNLKHFFQIKRLQIIHNPLLSTGTDALKITAFSRARNSQFRLVKG